MKRILPFLGLLLCSPCWAVLSVDSQMPSATAQTTASLPSPWTWSFTNTSGNAVYLWFATDANSPTVTATYGGTSMTKVGSRTISTGTGSEFLFRLSGAPPTGANNFSITSSVTAVFALGGGISFSGAANPSDSGTIVSSDWGGTTTLSWPVTITGTTSGNMVMEGVCYGDQQNTPTFSHTKTFNTTGNSSSFCNNIAAQYGNAPGGSVTMTITGDITATSFDAIGVEIKAASGGGGSTCTSKVTLKGVGCI